MLQHPEVTSSTSARGVERLLTVRQLADLWGVHERTIRRRIATGELEVVWLSPSAVRVRESAAAKFIAGRLSKAA
jgi:excisionase family DNA binding protein